MERNNIFQSKELVKSSFFKKLTGSANKKNAGIELNNLFAEKEWKDISQDEIQQIESKYKIKLNKVLISEIETIFSKCYASLLFEDEINQNLVNHLKEVLNISETQHSQIHQKVAEDRLKEFITQLTENNRFEDNEEKLLDQEISKLNLSKGVAQKIYNDTVYDKVDKYLKDKIEQGFLSPSEDQELNLMCESLGVKLQLNEESQRVLKKLKIVWQIKEGENLPQFESPVILQKKESCHFRGFANLNEQRRVTTKINYGGPTMRVKLAKGIYYRAGSVSAQTQSTDVWKTIDSGELIITNKRIIFSGRRGNKVIRFNEILDFKAFSNGLDIQKATGKSPFFEFSNHVDLAEMVLARVINDYLNS